MAEEAAVPAAALAWGETALKLHARLERLTDSQQAKLRLTANRDVLIVMGNSLDLPWVDGIEYAHDCPTAPGLWLPTQWYPDIDIDLLHKALKKRYERQPLLLWPHPAALIPLDRQLPLGPALLAQIVARWKGY